MALLESERNMHKQMLAIVKVSQALCRKFPDAKIVQIHDEIQCQIEDTDENMQYAQSVIADIEAELDNMTDDEIIAEVDRVRTVFRAHAIREAEEIENAKSR